MSGLQDLSDEQLLQEAQKLGIGMEALSDDDLIAEATSLGIKAQKPKKDEVVVPGLLAKDGDELVFFPAFSDRGRKLQKEMRSGSFIPDPTQTIPKAIRDLGVNVARLPFSVAEFFGSEKAGKISEGIEKGVPRVKAHGPAEEIGATVIQFGVPGAGGAKAAASLVPVAGMFSRLMRFGAGVTGAAAADVAVASPEEPTIGDLVGGPTAGVPGEPELVRRAKVGAEGLALGAGLGTLGAAGAGAGRAVSGGVDMLRRPRSPEAIIEAVEALRPTRAIERIVAKTLQDTATDPNLAAEMIVATQREIRQFGELLEIPSGTASADVGLIGLQRSLASSKELIGAQQTNLARIASMRQAVTRQLGGTRGDQTVEFFQKEARAQLETARLAVEAAEQGLETAQKTGRGMEEAATRARGTVVDASEQIHRMSASVLDQMTDVKTGLFTGIDPSRTAVIDPKRMTDAAADLLRQVGELSDKRLVIPEGVLTRLGRVAPQPPKIDVESGLPLLTGKVPPKVVVQDVVDLLPELSELARSARAQGRGALASSVGRLRSEAMEVLHDTARRGDAVGVRALEALRYFSEEFAPRFGAREGKEFRRAWRINKSEPGHLRATETPRRFLKPSTFGGTPESAAQLRLILGNGPEGVGAVRNYLSASMADYIGASPTAARIKAWRDSWKNVLRVYPEVGKEVDQTLASFLKNEEAVTEMGTALKAATAAQRGAKQGIKSSALRFWTDINDPVAGIEAIMKTTDPGKHMGEVAAMARRDVSGEAIQGLKQGLNDWVEQSVTNTSRNLIDEELVTSLAKMETLLGTKKMRTALSHVYNPAEMKVLDQTRRALNILNRQNIQGLSGSVTFEKMAAATQRGRILLASIFGIVKGKGIFAITRWLGQLTGRDPETMARTLLTRSMMDPELGRIMLAAPIDRAVLGRLEAYIANNILAGVLGEQDPMTPSEQVR